MLRHSVINGLFALMVGIELFATAVAVWSLT
jgi:hypothetical protein